MTQPSTLAQIEQSESRPMADILEDLKRIRAAKEKARVELEAIEQFEVGYRYELENRMQAEGIRTCEGHGLQVQRKSRRGVEVVDEKALRGAIVGAGRLEDFLKFDITRAKKAAIENMWPGVERTETTYISISEVKS